MFCEEDSHQLMTSGDEQVVFYHWVSARSGSSAAVETANWCSSCSCSGPWVGGGWTGEDILVEIWHVTTYVCQHV